MVLKTIKIIGNKGKYRKQTWKHKGNVYDMVHSRNFSNSLGYIYEYIHTMCLRVQLTIHDRQVVL